jgi:lipopolysaccharide assembly outer membrane protein LptD (OstA)
MIKKRFFLSVILTSLFLTALYAQEEPPPLDEPEAQEFINEEYQENEYEEEVYKEEEKEEKIVTPLDRRRDMEIKTSTLSELAAWCRTLGLSEGGTREDLSKRLKEHFNITETKINNLEKQKIITIESAQSSEYFTIDVIDEDYARLKGNVKITLKDGNQTHKINAEEILFNRTRNIISASGNVIYEKIETDKTETFRGKSITVNIDNWASVFLDGNSVMKDEGSSYLFSGSVIYRSDQEVTVLRKAIITSGNNDDDNYAYWSIRASKLWLLPGSDFAIFNAVLNVGEIPVLYIPFFYFPADDVVFHPVIGYRSREGGFIQTTTYIIGQPKTESTEKSSLTRIMGNSGNKEKELQGMFLRNTTRPLTNTNSTSLKALVDYYVNLGTYLGLDLSAPKKGILNQIDLSVGVGFTRSIAETSSGFSPYAPDYDGTFDWNKSNFLSLPVPFRYRMSFTSGLNTKYGNLSWNIPYYSDPYVNNDFLVRTENMDWVNMIEQGAAFEETSTNNEIGSYYWQLAGNINPSLPKLSPYISRLSVSSISTTLSFKTMTDNVVNQNNAYSPNRYFYAPDRLTIYSISGSVSGTPLTIGGTQSNTGKKDISQKTEDIFNGIGTPISPWASDNTDQEKAESTEVLIPPVLSQTFNIPVFGSTKFSIDYSISPTSSSELQFMSNWKTYEDVDWNDHQSILTSFGGNTNLNFHIDHSTGLFSNTIAFTGSGTWREYSYLNEEMFIDPVTGLVDEAKMEEKRRQQYSLTNYSSSYSYSGAINPFIMNSIFSQTNFKYDFRGTLVKSKKYTDGNGPELTPEWGSWVKEQKKDGEDILGLTSNKLSANLVAKIFDKDQNISVSAELPPIDGLVTAAATFRAWISETYFDYKMEKPETEEEWQHKPFNIRETLKFGKVGTFNHNMIFTPDEDYKITNVRSTLSLWKFTTDYSMTWTTKTIYKPYDPEKPHEGGEWINEGENELFPKDLKFSYNQSFPNMKIINNRFDLSFNLNTSLNFDLQKHTNSNFQFVMGLRMGITKLFNFEISATSQNAVIFRYFKGVPGMEDLTSMYTEGEQNNLLVDLFDSFNFLDEAKRRRSGFKMQKFNLKLNHILGDWDAQFEINMYPYQQRPTGAGELSSINIVSDITFFVHWNPITEIKSDITYDGRNERWSIK